MFNFLSKEEQISLDFMKGYYDEQLTNPLSIVEPKFEIKPKANVMASLQEKGYWEVTKKDMGNNMEIVFITLKDKFFEYYAVFYKESVFPQLGIAEKRRYDKI